MEGFMYVIVRSVEVELTLGDNCDDQRRNAFGHCGEVWVVRDS